MEASRWGSDTSTCPASHTHVERCATGLVGRLTTRRGVEASAGGELLSAPEKLFTPLAKQPDEGPTVAYHRPHHDLAHHRDRRSASGLAMVRGAIV